MTGHLRQNLGAIAVSILIMTVIPLAVERWKTVHDERISNATIFQIKYGDLNQFFHISNGMTAHDVAEEDPEYISSTTFDRFAWRDISTHQVLRLRCTYNKSRNIDVGERAPIRVLIEQGEKTISIAYSLKDFGLDQFVERGLDPKKCEFSWSKEWTLHLPGGVDRIYEAQSNTFRIVSK